MNKEFRFSKMRALSLCSSVFLLQFVQVFAFVFPIVFFKFEIGFYLIVINILFLALSLPGFLLAVNHWKRACKMRVVVESDRMIIFENGHKTVFSYDEINQVIDFLAPSLYTIPWSNFSYLQIENEKGKQVQISWLLVDGGNLLELMPSKVATKSSRKIVTFPRHR